MKGANFDRFSGKPLEQVRGNGHSPALEVSGDSADSLTPNVAAIICTTGDLDKSNCETNRQSPDTLVGCDATQHKPPHRNRLGADAPDSNSHAAARSRISVKTA